MSNEKRMPVFFIGHGSPMNAIEDNEFSRAWIEAARSIPKPESILCISAHWETDTPAVTAMPHPKTIHDFYGFPKELNEKVYPAPGSPPLAQKVTELLQPRTVSPDLNWGLDHGTWSVLCQMYPKADIPVVQLSLSTSLSYQEQYDLGKALGPLRDQGVLILGSGNIVHNLRRLVWEDTAFDWAVEFDQKIKDWIEKGEHDPIIHYEDQGQAAALSVNSGEHYAPLMYVLALQNKSEPVQFFNEKIWGGSLSMRCVRIG